MLENKLERLLRNDEGEPSICKISIDNDGEIEVETEAILIQNRAGQYFYYPLNDKERDCLGFEDFEDFKEYFDKKALNKDNTYFPPYEDILNEHASKDIVLDVREKDIYRLFLVKDVLDIVKQTSPNELEKIKNEFDVNIDGITFLDNNKELYDIVLKNKENNNTKEISASTSIEDRFEPLAKILNNIYKDKKEFVFIDVMNNKTLSDSSQTFEGVSDSDFEIFGCGKGDFYLEDMNYEYDFSTYESEKFGSQFNGKIYYFVEDFLEEYAKELNIEQDVLEKEIEQYTEKKDYESIGSALNDLCSNDDGYAIYNDALDSFWFNWGEKYLNQKLEEENLGEKLAFAHRKGKDWFVVPVYKDGDDISYSFDEVEVHPLVRDLPSQAEIEKAFKILEDAKNAIKNNIYEDFKFNFEENNPELVEKIKQIAENSHKTTRKQR